MTLTSAPPAVSTRVTWLRRLAVADLVVNILIVLTGGAVRLTGSGLGCPTWPRCTDESYVVHPSLGLHGGIEFGNRMLTFVLVAVAVACLVAAWRADPRSRRLALVVALGVPAQAVIGGMTVLTDLNPWLVAFHLLCSMAIIGVCVMLVDHVWSTSSPPSPVRRRDAAGWAADSRYARAASRLRWLVFAVGWVLLYLGTVVTGSGPHAGDADSPRTGLDIAVVAQVHAGAAYVLTGVTATLLVTAWQARLPGLVRAAAFLLVVELAQGAVGSLQYALGVPAGLVAVHLLGAALTSAGLVWVVLRGGPPRRQFPRPTGETAA